MHLQILATQQKLDEVKDVMVASVELVLERGERLELLVDKTDNLQQQVLLSTGTGTTVVLLYCFADRATFAGDVSYVHPSPGTCVS